MNQATEGAVPKGIDDLVQNREMTDEEAEQAFSGDSDAAVGDRMTDAIGGQAPAEGVPDWVVLPPGMQLPPGRQIGFMRFRAEWTDTPQKGERQCVVWPLTEAEEKLAYKRARGDAFRTIGELSKQMIRSVDGKKVTAGTSDLDVFWNDIGRRCCQMVQNYYVKTHTLNVEQQQDFFVNCFAVRTAAAG